MVNNMNQLDNQLIDIDLLWAQVQQQQHHHNSQLLVHN
jgi:hypothetical protein